MAKKQVVLFMFLLFLSVRMLNAKQELDLLLSFKSYINDPLQYLSTWNSSVTFCKWQSITCNDTSSHIISIDLSAKNISGKLSSSIFQLPYIQSINLSSNQLSGHIPEALFSSSSLLHLNLSNNNFTGSIPGGSISSLESLDLSNNMLSGKISQQIGSFSSLKLLDLGGNVLVGQIPMSITNITSLQFLTLASNQLHGQIPRGLGQMKSLKWIYLGYNNLSGEIPSEIGELNFLSHLDLVYNNLTGSIPSSLGNLTNLEYLFLYQNKLVGTIPNSIFNLRKLISLDLSDNSLSGEIPDLVVHLQNLEILHLFSNKFSGKIPNSLSSLPRLQVLQLWSNNFSGEIPEDLGKKNKLTVIDLSTNSLTGKIPEGLCSSNNLFKLILFSNSLEGELPRSLSSCRSLKRVRLQDNNLSGELPDGFTKLPLVYFLDISDNNLSGEIKTRKWEMTSLQMLNLARNRFFGGLPESVGSNNIENLDMSENRFSGIIPSSFGKLSELMQLRLRGNKLSGQIPDELCSCKKLVSLDLSDNRLDGHIPDGLSEMPVLGQLDLSQNQLNGEIPRNLGSVESLVQVNISHNHFHGSLPSTGTFVAINASAVAGNVLLCGGDISTGLPPCKRAIKNPTWWVYFVCALGALVLLGFATFGLVMVRRRRNLELKRVENEDGIWELQFFHSKVSKSITMDDILSSKKDENVISRGKKGLSYKSKSSINDMQFMVKEINDINSIPSNLWPEVAELGKLHHPNIVKLIGICRSDNKGAYLIYEYIEGKRLSEIVRNLSWERRRKIVLGIAKAVRFLHCHCSPSFYVGCLSPENVIVDGKDEPRLKLRLPDVDAKCFISSAYVAPETRDPTDINEKSDVYGLGLILIELLTGKSPADQEFGVHESIIEWARYCYSDCHIDTWIDPMIKGYVAINHNQNEIVEAMNLALHCTAVDPTARPRADDVFRTLRSSSRTGGSSFTSLKFSSPF